MTLIQESSEKSHLSVSLMIKIVIIVNRIGKSSQLTIFIDVRGILRNFFFSFANINI